jgi:hypothetical protein
VRLTKETTMKQFLLENAKAMVAALTVLGTWGATAAPGGITGAEWFGLTGVPVAFLVTWMATNAPTEGQLTRLAEWKLEAPEIPPPGM